MPGLAEVGNEIPRSSALPRKQAESHRATGLILFVLFFAFAFGIQRWSGTLQPDSEAAHYPDEPAHVVTSLMIHDYVKAFFPGSPQRFAETYYLHYPKVAFGIWPPVFHITAAIWMLIFGASKRSLLLLIASQAAVLASLLFRFSRGIFGPALSAALCAGFLISFPMRYNATMVMLDVLVALLAFCSMLCLLRFFETRKTSDGMAFGVVTAVAMLTKGNADALVLMPVALILLTRQWDVLKTKGLYAAAAVVVFVGGPWQIWSWRILQRTIPISHVDQSHLADAVLDYGRFLLEGFGWPLMYIAAIGATAFLVSQWKKAGKASAPLSGALSLFLAVFVFQCIAPVPRDARYILPLVPPFLIFVVYGLRSVVALLPLPGVVKDVAVGVAALLLLMASPLPAPKRTPLGFSHVAKALENPAAPSKVALICSDGDGEGALIDEVAFRDRRPDRFVVRGSKVLSDNPWDPDGYRPRFSSPQMLLDYLDSVPVDAVVVDRQGYIWKADRDLLLQALALAPDRWRMTEDIPLSAASRPLAVYRRISGPAPSSNPHLLLDMRYSLGKSLETE